VHSRDILVVRCRGIGGADNRHIVGRRVDVEFLPGAPHRPVVDAHEQVVGPGTTLEGRRVGQRRGQRERDAGRLYNPMERPVPAYRIAGRVRELVGGDRVTVTIAGTEQIHGRDILVVGRRGVRGAYGGRMIDRRVDVELLPRTPQRPVGDPHKQVVGPGT